MISSFHEAKHGTVQYDGSSSDPFPIRSYVKQGCVLAPTIFGIFSSLLLSYAFNQSKDGVHLNTRNDGSLLNLARLRAKTKVWKVLIREMLFADEAALTVHTDIKKTNVMGQDVSSIPSISIDGHILEAVDEFTYLDSTISSNLSLDAG
ncbi:uncharacterized protein LOC143034109 [Oratosquilla oratoria]|uniref:uncharacterized protein LOC143034109 n=1 Tax=Oratosquilla oratoria TaxID=337810 RepID=UPI003F76F2CF